MAIPLKENDEYFDINMTTDGTEKQLNIKLKK